jgi:hypothetical protein
MRAQMVGLIPLAIPSAFSDRFRDQTEHQAPRAFTPCDGLLIRTVTSKFSSRPAQRCGTREGTCQWLTDR